MMSEITYTTRELCKEFAVTSRSIRFYEDQGLLFPDRDGQHRLFSRQDRVRLILILRGKRLGFSIAEIRELLSLWDDTPTGSRIQLEETIHKISDKRRVLDQQLRDIAILQLELEQAETRCREALLPR
ncbi:MerR family transcriptional regulator [Pontibacter sp. JAM-7]|uniref:MerR family transcriptional regulator n=1 Tax=Pontibacter sp. JAM-7 TaxID=3366581 RepID=UPI003AF7F136